MKKTTQRQKVAIIGARIIGCTLVMKSLKVGYGVTLFERDATSKGASASNFGLIMVSELTKGEDLRLRLASSAQGQELSVKISEIDFRAGRSLELFKSQTELQWTQRTIDRGSNNQRKLKIIDQWDLKHFGLVVLNSNVLGRLLSDSYPSVEPGTALAEIIKYLNSSLNCNLRFWVKPIEVDDNAVETPDGIQEEFRIVSATPRENYGSFLARHTAPKKTSLRISRAVGLKRQRIKATVGPVIIDREALAHHVTHSSNTCPVKDPPQDASSEMRYDLQLSSRRPADSSVFLRTTDNKDPQDEFRIDVTMTEYISGSLSPLITAGKLYSGAIWEGVYSCTQDPLRDCVALARQSIPIGFRGLPRRTNLSLAIADEIVSWIK
ncbi:FAD-dependent oxidoreductase [Acidithrix ferrooxidans]|uniref:tRNA 5-methylaminomethyl-2-thiouridine biosynthesis bifunctional protein MnmC n=1 Tax=Acidithrix ferrooxidans TaxID=1280514 RepID=A0A0D8HH62_9ACTN|nr:FAD-dependent oxidoreductase [Acidithrix ferrooxidans]KJF17268.1 tRNA 5-methylaminomethyl-2-thiouridine biosynthesis bifunctional protein MnmC [Acidithrix ferrooxidans]